MVLDIIVGIGLPISLVMLYKKKYEVRLIPFIVGIGSYIVVSMFILGIFDSVIYMTPLYELLENMPAVNAVFYGIFHGLIQFGGYYVIVKYFTKGFDRKENSLMLGVGFSFVTSAFTNGVGCFGNLLVAINVNELGLEGYLSVQDAELADDYREAIMSIVEMPIFDVVCVIILTIVDIGFMLAFAILLFQACKREGKSFLIPTTIAGIVLYNLASCIYSVDLIGQITYLILVSLLAAAALFLAYIYYGADKADIRGKADFVKRTIK